ncbi:hypothetical protein NU688_04765 [Variovorax sp. ZS18.2.2]|uniref:hypothetical protein n=1 Tax=Variovorax sp. ZS18.2.2 TaxID=2971255 RepID=UPI002151A35E|nr:hypothetical protein [Variovorax sp. ZS18.2.2]MCR6475460.1 hypothetical protein [Variovorax sp. ZS18.2.2]
MLKSLIPAMMIAASLPALAGSANGRVNLIAVQPGVIVIEIANQVDRPACATMTGFTIDGSSSEGKNTMALALAAASQNKSISVTGKGVCTLTGNRENIAYVVVVN